MNAQSVYWVSLRTKKRSMDMDIFWFGLGILVVAFTLFFVKRAADMDEGEK